METKVKLKPDEPWCPIYINTEEETFVLPVGNQEELNKPKTCTCGIEAIGGGIHSDWCDKYESN